MADATDPAFQQAFDNLMTQVDTDNVLAVHTVFQQNADNLEADLSQLRARTRVGLCGGDPVSQDAATAFNAKIDQLLEVHWRHYDELNRVAGLLRSAARDYGKTEQEIAASFPTER